MFLTTDKGEAVLRQSHTHQHECGANWIELLNKSQMNRQFPWLQLENDEHEVTLGSFGHKNEGYFDPWSLLQAMKAKSIELGVKYIDGEVVNAKIHHEGKYRIESLDVIFSKDKDNDKIKEISQFSAGNYVNATGPFAGKFVDMLIASAAVNNINTRSITTLPVEARKRCVFVINCNIPENSPLIVPPRSTPLVIDPTGVWFRYTFCKIL